MRLDSDACRWSLAFVITVGFLAGVGCDSKTKSASSKEKKTKKQKADEEDDEFVAGSKADSFTFALESNPESLDPTRISGVPGGRVAFNIFEGLLMPAKTTEVAEEPGDLVRPGVAKDYEISDDGKTYTFKLREDAKWSNGDPVTAKDFIFSWKRTLLPGYPANYAELFYVIEGVEEYNDEDSESDWSNVGIEAPDKHTLTIDLTHPTPYFPELAAFYTLFPQPKSVVKEHGSDWTKPEYVRTNGAYTLAEHVEGREIVLEKNENYWDADNVDIEKVTIKIIEDSDELVEAWEDEMLHWTGTSLAPWQVPEYRDSEAFHEEQTLGTYYVRVNVSDEDSPLADPRFTQALGHAVDRKALVDEELNGVYQVADSFIPEEMPGYASQGQLKSDREEAKKLLEELEISPEEFREVELLYNKGKMHKRVVDALASTWEEELGLTIKPVEKTWEDYLEDIDITNYDLARSGWVGDYSDPLTFLSMWQTGNGNNDTGWSNEKYDELVADAMAAKKSPERVKQLLQAEELLLSEGPIIPIFHFAEHVLVGENVEGYAVHNRNIHQVKDFELKE